jgi:hypothetical protein
MERLRTAALAALIGGAVGSGGLMMYAAQRVHAPRVLLVGFTLWVLSPFALLAVANAVSDRRRWSFETRRALDIAMLLVAAVSLIVYGVFALGANRPKTAPFVLLAPVCWLATAVVVSTAAFTSRKRSIRSRASRTPPE